LIEQVKRWRDLVIHGDRRRLREVRELPRDLHKVLDIGEDTGIRFVHPT
jgi:hypothetical protein